MKTETGPVCHGCNRPFQKGENIEYVMGEEHHGSCAGVARKQLREQGLPVSVAVVELTRQCLRPWAWWPFTAFF